MSSVAMNPLLFSLLRFGLFGGKNPFDEGAAVPDDAGWQHLFDDAKHQAVSALLYDAVLMLPKGQRPPRRVLFHFTTLTQSIEHDNELRHNALIEFSNDMRRRLDLSIVVVKGSSLADYYPQLLHRECGDNDLFTGHDTSKVAALLESDGVSVDRKDPRHLTFTFRGVTFESHNYLLYHGDEPQWSAQPFHDGLYHLPPAQEAFFLAMHAEHHAVFFHQPLLLRTLLDWCMLLRSPEFHYEDLELLKKGTDVEVFANLLTAYCRQLLDDQLCVDTALNLHGVTLSDFEKIYLHCPQRHPLAFIRVLRRSWKYLRFGRQYRAIYGVGMFRRFYCNNLVVALRNRFHLSSSGTQFPEQH